jgi:hypothetical protein
VPALADNWGQTGFIVSASSYQGVNNMPYYAFDPQIPKTRDWCTSGQGVGAWLQIECPAPIRIWKVHLRGRVGDTQCMTRWTLTASSDGSTFTTLLTSDKRIGGADFLIIDDNYFTIPLGTSYKIFRITALAVDAGTTSTGLHHVQLFTCNI